jgi:hypothetical protein
MNRPRYNLIRGFHPLGQCGASLGSQYQTPLKIAFEPTNPPEKHVVSAPLNMLGEAYSILMI